jgi:branched-chain amino acid transport system permease protein
MRAGSRPWSRVVALALLAGVLISVPQMAINMYEIHLLNLAAISVVFALSLNLVLGFAGQISLGHAAFFGLGAYASALLTRDWQVPVLLAMLLAMLITAAFGLGVGIPTLRIGGHYLAMVTIAFGQIASVIFMNAAGITGGYNGIRGIPPVAIGTLRLAGERHIYYFLLAMCALMIWISTNLKRSMLGRSMLALREDEAAAQALGVNTMVVKIQAFVLSAAFAGLAGAMYAHWVGFISPDSFTIDLSIGVFSMVLVGGVGSVPGVVFGAVLLTFLPEYLRFMKDYYRLIYGAVLIIFIVFLPGGIASLASSAAARRVLGRLETGALFRGVQDAKRTHSGS